MIKTLPATDYLSTISRGSDITGRMLAHLGNPQDDVHGNLVLTHDPGALLDLHGNFTTHLRYHSGLIKDDLSVV